MDDECRQLEYLSVIVSSDTYESMLGTSSYDEIPSCILNSELIELRAMLRRSKQCQGELYTLLNLLLFLLLNASAEG